MTKKCRKCREEKSLSQFQPMNIGKYGVASTCKQCQMIKDFSSSKPIKQISEKKKTRLKETGGEKSTFIKVNKIDKFCWICGKFIVENFSYTFPHLLAKSSHPALRDFVNNIGRCCSIECHSEIDKKINLIKKDLEKYNKLKQWIIDGERRGIKKLVLNNKI